MSGVLIAVTDHAADRFRQRVRGTLDAKAEITRRVGEAWAAGSRRAGRQGATDVQDLRDRSLIYVCRHDVPRGELVVVTLWEEGPGRAGPAPVHRRGRRVAARPCADPRSSPCSRPP